MNFYVHYMESQGFEDPAYEESLSAALRREYSSVKLDLVIVAAYPALRFAVAHRDQIFPGVPVLFSYVYPGRVEGRQLWPGVTGVTVSVGVQDTLELAFRLHPGTQNLALVAGTSEFERFWRAAVRNEFRPYADKVKLIEIAGLRNEEILKQVAKLPTSTVVLFQVIPRDSTQPEIGLYDTIATISHRFPTYCIFRNFCIDHGGVGGSYADYAKQSSRTGEIAARLLSGEKPENIPVQHDSGNRALVDWRQLRRWNIAESALPPGAMILYRRPSAWERYEKYILAGVAVIILQALLIAGLLWQRVRRRKSELTLRESEERFQLMADTTPSLVWMCASDGEVTYFNGRRIDFTGCDPNAGFGDAWSTYIYPDDLQSVQTANALALGTHQAFSKEYRLQRRDGEYRWMLDVASPRKDGTGAFAGFVGSAIDISDQKLAHEALEKVSGKLIKAQEEERSRIARELHDDFSQHLAIQSIELTQLEKNLPASEVKERALALKLLKDIKEISADMRSLSHQLHSSRLELVGLVPALSGLCEEITAKYQIDVCFTEHESSLNLAKDVELCLFRVAQEALKNVVRHSQAKAARVELDATANGVRLCISDTGKGFDPDKKNGNGGIGLISMRERIRIVGGTLSIRSEFMRGTVITAEVPLRASANESHVSIHAAGGMGS